MSDFFNKIKELFLSFFKKNKQDIADSNVSENGKEDNKETIKDLSINWDFINDTKQYDIFLVKMNNYDIKANRIEREHQFRPFLLLDKDNSRNIATGYYLTSNIYSNYYRRKSLKLLISKTDYKLNRDSIIQFNTLKEIPYTNILFLIDSLKTNDIIKLNKYRSLLSNCDVKASDTLIEIGDIIKKDNDKYIITTINDNVYSGYKVNINNSININYPTYSIFRYKHDYYEVDYSHELNFDINDNYYINGRVNNNAIQNIIDGKYMANGNMNREYKIGDIIMYNNKHYIIHQKDNSYYYGYFIKQSNDIYNPKKDFNHFEFGKTQFYVDYSDNISLKRDEQNPLIDWVNSELVDSIKNKKIELKHYNKIKKKSIKKS